MSEFLVYPDWLDAIGMFSAFLAFSIAVYIQVFIEQKVPAKYVVSFTATGLGLWALSVQGVGYGIVGIYVVRTLGYVIFIGLMIFQFIKVRECLNEAN